MRYYRLTGDDGETRLAAEVEDDVLYDLTSIDEDLTEVDDLAAAGLFTRRQCGHDALSDHHATQVVSDKGADSSGRAVAIPCQRHKPAQGL